MRIENCHSGGSDEEARKRLGDDCEVFKITRATLHFNVISEEYITLFTILPYQKTGRLLPLYYKKVKDEL